MGITKTEKLAFDILYAVSEAGGKSHLQLTDTFAGHPELTAIDRAAVTNFVHGTLEKQILLDLRIEELSNLPVRKMKPKVRCALRLGFYQLLFLDRVPASRIIRDCVELTRKSGYEGLTGFVNGVLRKASVKTDWKAVPEAAAAGFPAWLWDRLVQEYGICAVREMAASLGSRNPLTLRINVSRMAPEEAKRLLEEDGWICEPTVLAEAVSLRRGEAAVPLERTRLLSGGFAVPQDLSSILAVRLAAPARGDKVLDLCAAPGGKSIHAADLVGKEGYVLSCDLTEKKVRLLEENIRRNGFENICARQADALVFDREKVGAYDLVIADLPCSGLGVIGRKPEIRFRVTEEEIRSLAALQRDILQQAAAYVKPGGKLLFSTCTMTREENQENAAWLKEKAGFEPVSLEGAVPEPFAGALQENCLQLLPSGLSDGFFISVWRKPR